MAIPPGADLSPTRRAQASRRVQETYKAPKWIVALP